MEFLLIVLFFVLVVIIMVLILVKNYCKTVNTTIDYEAVPLITLSSPTLTPMSITSGEPLSRSTSISSWSSDDCQFSPFNYDPDQDRYYDSPVSADFDEPINWSAES